MNNAVHIELVVCVENKGYQALEKRKIYRALPDVEATEHRRVRVIDESGEDYLYPADYFIPISLPDGVVQALSLGDQ